MPAAYPVALQFLCVGLGGCLGAMLRYGVQQLPFIEHNTYYYTLAVNLTGSLLIGIAWVILTSTGAHQAWYHILITGLLGGYTTYSAFSLDFVQLLRADRLAEAAAYWGVTVVCAPALCALGYYLTSKLLK